MVIAASAAKMPALIYDVRPVRWTLCKAAGWLSPAAFWSRLSGLRLREVGVPELPSPEWVRLRPILGGVCGSDLATITQRSHPASILQSVTSFPAVLGHENVSIVEQVGSAVSGWRVGDRVVVEPSISCVPRGISPVCRNCAAGRFTLCENFRAGPLPIGSMIGYNSFTGGSWSPCFIAHQSQLYRVPEDINDETAVLVDPLAGALHAVLRRTPRDDETVLILGAGLLGLGVAAAIRAVQSKCRLVGVVRDEHQAGLIRRFGADETMCVGRAESQAQRYSRVGGLVGGRAVPSKFGHQMILGGGFDVVYDCVGTGRSLTDAMKYARPRGLVVEVGTSNLSLVDTAPLWFNELEIIGANGRAIEQYQGRSLHTYEIVFELIRQGRLDLNGLVTHRFTIRQYREAFATLIHRDRSRAIKAVFVQEN